jgi:hypothetical protein
MSCGLTHCPHVDRLLISSSVLPECPVNNGVDNGIELCRGSITCPQNYRVDQGSTLFENEKNDGEKQNFVTPGLVMGRFGLLGRVGFTVGGGYQIATTHFHTTNHNAILSIRFPF